MWGECRELMSNMNVCAHFALSLMTNMVLAIIWKNAVLIIKTRDENILNWYMCMQLNRDFKNVSGLKNHCIAHEMTAVVNELLRDVLLWTPTHGRAKAGRPARTNIQQLCEDTGRCPEDLPRVMNEREEWRERIRDIGATSATWWWFDGF